MSSSIIGAVVDPVADYLRISQENIHGRSDRQFYTDDAAYSVEVDLNNDGTNEFLVSSSLDRDGKQGNVFYLYKKVQGGFDHVDALHLNMEGFYFGPIKEADSFGIVKFWPAGGGQGCITAHIFDGFKLRQIELGQVELDPATLELKHPPFWDKYFGEKALRITDQIKILTSQDLSKKYGVNIQPRTYAESVESPVSSPKNRPKSSLSTESLPESSLHHPRALKQIQR